MITSWLGVRRGQQAGCLALALAGGKGAGAWQRGRRPAPLRVDTSGAPAARQLSAGKPLTLKGWMKMLLRTFARGITRLGAMAGWLDGRGREARAACW